MAVWFVSRHEGAKEWMRSQGIEIDRWVDHLEPEAVELGDKVFGVLPLEMIATINAKGVPFYALTYRVDKIQRGQELSAQTLERLGCRLQRYQVQVLENGYEGF